MAATDRPSRRRRWPVLGAAGLVALVVVTAVAIHSRGDDVGALPPLPPTSRDDVELAVDARRVAGGVAVTLVLGVGEGATVGLPVVDWGGDAHGWSPSPGRLWEPGVSPRPWWSPAVGTDRLSGGQVVIHLGPGRRVDPEGLLRMEPLDDHERVIDPGEEVGAEVQVDDVPGPEVRVCVWAAGTGPDDPGARPAAGADGRA